MIDEGNVSAKTIWRKHLKKQIWHMLKQTIGWILAGWLLGGGVIVAVVFAFGALIYSNYWLGIKGSNLGMAVFAIWFFIWIFTWIITIILIFLEEIWIRIQKNLKIARENTEKEVAIIERKECPECKSKIDLQTVFCDHCGVQLRIKSSSTDSYVWHYSG